MAVLHSRLISELFSVKYVFVSKLVIFSKYFSWIYYLHQSAIIITLMAANIVRMNHKLNDELLAHRIWSKIIWTVFDIPIF